MTEDLILRDNVKKYCESRDMSITEEALDKLNEIVYKDLEELVKNVKERQREGSEKI